jgi:hypothetical protein
MRFIAEPRLISPVFSSALGQKVHSQMGLCCRPCFVTMPLLLRFRPNQMNHICPVAFHFLDFKT